MTNLVRGANVALDALASGIEDVQVGIGWEAGPSGDGAVDLDVGTFLLGADGSNLGPGAVVYFNQTATSDGAVTLDRDATAGGAVGDAETLTAHLRRLPAAVSKVVFVVWIHDAVNRRHTFSHVRGAYIRVVDPRSGGELARFELGAITGGETAMTFGELYRHPSGWKLRAVGQGYDGGVSSLARAYGVDFALLDLTKQTPAPPAVPTPTAAATGPTPTRVILTKLAPSVSLVKKGTAGGVMRVNLNWDRRPATPGGGTGFLRKKGTSGLIDLDLGCLYEFSDGTKGVVQALGGAFQSISRHPVPLIWLDGDDRTGEAAGGENLYVDLRRAADVRRVLVFTMIYEGAPNWAAVNGVVTLVPAVGAQVEIALDGHDFRARMCAIALLENIEGEVKVRREVRYVQGSQSAVDRAYGWGLNWSPGRK